jgi:26S proteasome regulatory subunit N7
VSVPELARLAILTWRSHSLKLLLLRGPWAILKQQQKPASLPKDFHTCTTSAAPPCIYLFSINYSSDTLSKMGSDPQYAKYPDLALSQHIFNLTNASATTIVQQASLKSLQDAISEQKMAPLYRYLAHPVDGILNPSGEGSATKPGARKQSNIVIPIAASKKIANKVDFPWDEKLYESLVVENKKELETYTKEEEEAAEKAGDTEVQAAKGKRAEFWARVGDKVSYKPSLYSLVYLGLKLTTFDALRMKLSLPTNLFSKRLVCWATRSTSY